MIIPQVSRCIAHLVLIASSCLVTDDSTGTVRLYEIVWHTSQKNLRQFENKEICVIFWKFESNWRTVVDEIQYVSKTVAFVGSFTTFEYFSFYLYCQFMISGIQALLSHSHMMLTKLQKGMHDACSMMQPWVATVRYKLDHRMIGVDCTQWFYDLICCLVDFIVFPFYFSCCLLFLICSNFHSHWCCIPPSLHLFIMSFLLVSIFLLCLFSSSSHYYITSVSSARVCPKLNERLLHAREKLKHSERKPKLFFADTEGVNYEMYKVNS